MRLLPFLFLTFTLVARVSAQFGGDEDRMEHGSTDGTIDILPNDETPTMLPPMYGSTGMAPIVPTESPPVKPTVKPTPGPVPVPVQPAHHCPRYLAHAACRQCVSAKGSLGYTPVNDLHFCPISPHYQYDHLGECKPITTPCTSSLSTPIRNITSCPNDVAESKPSCGACTADAYVWCQADDSVFDEYKGICRDAAGLFTSRAAAEYALRSRELRDEDDMTIDAIDRLCGPTHTAILTRRDCPRRHIHTGRFMMYMMFHLIPILLCLSACCLCIRAVRRRRAARRSPLLDGSAAVPTPTPAAPSAPISEYTSTSYPANTTLPLPLPNGGYLAPSYVAPAATAPQAVPMQSFYPTLSNNNNNNNQGLHAPLLQQPSNHHDGLIYAGHVYPTGYSRVQQEI